MGTVDVPGFYDVDEDRPDATPTMAAREDIGADGDDLSRPIGHFPTVATAMASAERPTACEVVGTEDGFRFGEEIPIDFEIVPRLVYLPDGGSRVLFRFEARPRAKRGRRDAGRFKSDADRLANQGLVIALWPYQSGVLDWMRFRRRGNKDGARGREALRRRAAQGALQDWLDYIDDHEAKKTDYVLSDSSYQVAGKFSLKRDCDDWPRVDRAVVPRWTFGLCSEEIYNAARLWLSDRRDLIELSLIQQPPRIPPDMRPSEWAPEQLDLFMEIAADRDDDIVVRYAAFALAGYQKRDRERFFERTGGSLVEYAAEIVRREVRREARRRRPDLFKDRPGHQSFERGAAYDVEDYDADFYDDD